MLWKLTIGPFVLESRQCTSLLSHHRFPENMPTSFNSNGLLSNFGTVSHVSDWMKVLLTRVVFLIVIESLF